MPLQQELLKYIPKSSFRVDTMCGARKELLFGLFVK